MGNDISDVCRIDVGKEGSFKMGSWCHEFTRSPIAFVKPLFTFLMHPGSPNAAHIYFNTIWVSELDKNTIVDDMNWIIRLYNDANVRKQSLERLESDLLQYRFSSPVHGNDRKELSSTSLYPNL